MINWASTGERSVCLLLFTALDAAELFSGSQWLHWQLALTVCVMAKECWTHATVATAA